MKYFTPKNLLLALVCLLITACNRDKDDKPETVDLTFAQDSELSESETANVRNLVDAQVNGGSGKTQDGLIWQLPNGASATLDVSATPRTLVINFGSTGILCNDLRTRRGIIRASWTGNYRDANTVITTTTENYYVNDNRHQLRRVVTNQGANAAGNITFAVVENDTVTLKNNGGVIYWSSNRTREWVAGTTTALNIYDDVYRITGSATGIGRNGNPYTLTIQQPLEIHVDCPFIYKGVLLAQPQNAQDVTINYGEGCATGKTATVTIGRFSGQIPLR
ncbi:MAG: hypothetical protein ACK5XP_04050 [Sphingobacteriia bacterium]|jgi:hypothetical protein